VVIAMPAMKMNCWLIGPLRDGFGLI